MNAHSNTCAAACCGRPFGAFGGRAAVYLAPVADAVLRPSRRRPRPAAGRAGRGPVATILWASLAVAGLLAAETTLAAAGQDGPKPIPQTRPEMKQRLEALKERTPRLPLPGPGGEPARLSVNNGRARARYLPGEWFAADFRRDAPSLVDEVLKVKLFWIASRANNCHYCLGHQELKLARAGLTDDEIAILDVDWTRLPEVEQNCIRLAHKLTLAPHELTAADVEALRPAYDDAQIVELVEAIARFNSTNRWTDGLGLPQDRSFRDAAATLLTPTSTEFENAPSCVIRQAPGPRPSWESPAEVADRMRAAAGRTARVRLIDRDEVCLIVPGLSAAEVPNWARALAHAPHLLAARWQADQALFAVGDIPSELKAALAWTVARENRAWYAVGRARARLRQLGWSDERIESLAGPDGGGPSDLAAALAFARKSTSAPQTIADADVERLREHYSDRQAAQIVYLVCWANYFDRLSEALALPLEPELVP